MCACAGSRLADSEAVVVLGLGTLELDIPRNHLVRHFAAAAHEVAARSQVPTPELRPQLQPLAILRDEHEVGQFEISAGSSAYHSWKLSSRHAC